MEQIIEASQATISQAVITINAVRIGKKQMTQSVFNQLPVPWRGNPIHPIALDVFDEKIWGSVNYHTDCKKDSKHLHLIIQLDGILYKTIFYFPLDDNKHCYDVIKDHYFIANGVRGPHPITRDCREMIEYCDPDEIINTYNELYRISKEKYSKWEFNQLFIAV